MTIADYAVIVLLVLFIVACACAYTWYDRAKNLTADCERKDAIQRAHLEASAELLATMKELERYNASLEQQLQRERIVQLHRRVEWSVN